MVKPSPVYNRVGVTGGGHLAIGSATVDRGRSLRLSWSFCGGLAEEVVHPGRGGAPVQPSAHLPLLARLPHRGSSANVGVAGIGRCVTASPSHI